MGNSDVNQSLAARIVGSYDRGSSQRLGGRGRGQRRKIGRRVVGVGTGHLHYCLRPRPCWLESIDVKQSFAEEVLGLDR